VVELSLKVIEPVGTLVAPVTFTLAKKVTGAPAGAGFDSETKLTRIVGAAVADGCEHAEAASGKINSIEIASPIINAGTFCRDITAS
jgi:hypothetical protein